MEEIHASPPPRTVDFPATTRRKPEQSGLSNMKVHCLSFAASLKESFVYVKAFFVGQAKMITARNEKEATEAELQTEKMQVDATDAAENTKKRLNTSF